MSEIMIYTIFAIFSIMRITGVEISKKSKCAKTNCIFEKFEITLFLIYTVCARSEMMIYTLFAMVSMMRIRGVEIS